MTQRRSSYVRRALFAAVAVTLVWLTFGLPASGQQKGEGDPFDKVNEAKGDPFSVLNQAPQPVLAPDVKKDAGPKTDSDPDAKDVPKSPKGAEDLIDFYTSVSPKEVVREQTIRVTVTGIPRKGCYTYSMTKATPDQKGPAISKFKIRPTPGLQPLVPIEESEPQLVPVFDGLTTQLKFEHKKKFTWSFDVLVRADAKPGAAEFAFTAALQVCNTSCYLGEFPFTATFTVSAADPVPVSADLQARGAFPFPPPPLVIGQDSNFAQPKKTDEPLPSGKVAIIPRDFKESMERVRKQILAPETKPDEGLLMFILTGMFWGFVSLITPCVFPMIPITVSFFLKQSEKEHHKPVTMALVYCGTIIVVLTIAAAALLNFFRFLSINPAMNFGLGALFIFFALSLFGMYEIELPSFLARYTSERESKGGMIGTMFMALTFTIISFACVAPFLGGFGGTADTTARPFWHTILGGLAFAITFASPFFVLALFPTLLKAMPKSGAWLNSVKVVMGFLELAAALKFFRAGELVLPSPPGIFTFDLVLGLWVAICALCGLYLLGIYRLPHDSPVEHLTVPRLMFALAFLGLGFYLLPGLLVKPAEGEQQRSSGEISAWVYAFLLAEPRAGSGEVWSPNLEDAVAQARDYRKRTGKAKLIFVDFTGEVCNNCRLNENNVFSKSEMQKLLKPYVLVQLYCDSVPLKFYPAEDRLAAGSGRRTTDAKINESFEKAIFDTVELPLYTIFEPLPDGTIKVHGRISGLLKETEFAEFLKQPQQAAGANVASR